MPIISWKGKKLHFECRAGFALLTLFLLGLMIRAGFWQLDRAAQKENLQVEYEQHTSLPLMSVIGALPDADTLRFRRLRLRGRYDNDHQFLLDNRSRTLENGAHRIGYEVLTPLRLDWGGVVLVNRGWVPAAVDRSVLPDISISDEERQLNGVLNIPSRGFALGALDSDNRWPRRIQFYDFTELAKRLNTDLYPAVVMLDADQPGGYLRNWRPVIKGPAMHYGYAVQWFAMALATIVLFGWFTVRRIKDDENR